LSVIAILNSLAKPKKQFPESPFSVNHEGVRVDEANLDSAVEVFLPYSRLKRDHG